MCLRVRGWTTIWTCWARMPSNVSYLPYVGTSTSIARCDWEGCLFTGWLEFLITYKLWIHLSWGCSLGDRYRVPLNLRRVPITHVESWIIEHCTAISNTGFSSVPLKHPRINEVKCPSLQTGSSHTPGTNILAFVLVFCSPFLAPQLNPKTRLSPHTRSSASSLEDLQQQKVKKAAVHTQENSEGGECWAINIICPLLVGSEPQEGSIGKNDNPPCYDCE